MSFVSFSLAVIFIIRLFSTSAFRVPKLIGGHFGSETKVLLSVVALGPLHDKIRLSPRRVLPRRKVPDQKGNEMTSRSNVRESA